MKPKKQKQTNRNQLYLVVTVLFILISVLYLYLYKNNKQTSSQTQPSDVSDSIETKQGIRFQFGSDSKQTINTGIKEYSSVSSKDAPSYPESNGIDNVTLTYTKTELTSDLSSTHDIEGSKPFHSTCDDSSLIVKSFYSHLDSKPYIKQQLGGISSQIHFSSLIEKLGKNPPVVSKETDDLFTILKNTAHFFRVIGNDNITLVKQLLNEEREQYEKALPHFYYVTTKPECLIKEFNISISKEVLYDYAGFFLNTMGGRLYLFRRDSVSRLTVTYYSILLIDQANENSENYHGVALYPFIKALIPEIENSGTQIQMKYIYLKALYSLEEKYRFQANDSQ